ncbi:MAG TPA: CHAD domain-containing protein, partial [Candidatus Angelobacter sp.]|nr:CHAD domain-containing protein [Candidatus Angelobacter sp.]
MRGLTTDLSAAVSRLAENDVAPKAVHRLRTTIRRIESLISYSHPDLDKKLERSLEKLTDLRKRAGKVRDMDVQIALLGVLANGSTVKDRETLAELLGKMRDRQTQRLVSAVQKLRRSKFFARMNRIAERAGAVPEGRNRPLAPLEEARAQLAVMAGDFASQNLSHQNQKISRLHDARISLKRIRYLAELAEKSTGQKSFIRELKAVQDAGGDGHDWLELTNTAEKRFSDRANCALLREVRALLADRHTAATSSIANLFA